MSEPETMRAEARAVRAFPAELGERVLRAHPAPIADAVVALLGADNAFEERDRIVEVFRAELRLLAALVLAARMQFGPGPAGEGKQVPELLRTLRARGLTDGQWVAIVRETLRPWSASPDAHPLPALVRLVHAKKSELIKLWDELLVMRKSETVAHGAAGTKDTLDAILERRTPQLARTLELLDPLWASARIALPRAEAHGALLFMGATPQGGRFRRVDLAAGAALVAGEPVVVDETLTPRLGLHPIVLARRATLDAPEELFLLDGSAKRGALYVAFPSMSEHREATAWASLDEVMAGDDPPASEEPSGDRPYRGLASFGPEHAGLFFGREDQAESLANRVRRHGLITVTGASGSGKTSLLRAGVLPLLRDAKAAYVRPGAHPLAALATRVAEATAIERPEIEALLAEPLRLRARIAEAAAGALTVLVIDQAEELVTLAADADERIAFARALVALGQNDGATRVVLSVREDFFARLATVKPLFGAFSQQVEVVTTPDKEALARMLVGPANAFGYAFEDLELVNAMIAAVEGAGAALALLSFAADRLWEARDRKWKRLTGAAYEALGGAMGALAQHASGVLAQLSPSETRACRALFLRLVTGERTRAVCNVEELLEVARDRDETARVLERLIGARLLTASEDTSGASTVELVHEALVSHWDVLVGWLSEDEAGQRLFHALRQTAREWHARGEPNGLLWHGEQQIELERYAGRGAQLTGVELAFSAACQREAKRARRLRIGLVVAAFAAVALFAGFMFTQWRAAEEARQDVVREQAETAKEKLRAEIRGLVAEARGREARGLVDDAHALLRAAVFLEGELGETGDTRELYDLARLDGAGAGAIALGGPSRQVMAAATAPSHRLVFVVGTDDDIFVFDAKSAAVVGKLPHPSWLVRAIEVSPDERFVATASADHRDEKGMLRVFALPSLELRHEAPLTHAYREIAFRGDGRALVVRASDTPPILLELDGFRAIPLGDEAAVDVAAGKALVAVTSERHTAIYDAGGRRTIALPDAPKPEDEKAKPETFASVALSPDDRLVARGWQTGKLELFHADSGAPRSEARFGGERIGALRFAAGERLVIGTLEGKLHVAQLGVPGTLDFKPGVGLPEFAVAGKLLAFIDDKKVKLYDLESGVKLLDRQGHEGSTVSVSFYGDRLLTLGWDKMARLSAERPYPVRRSILVGPGLKRAAFSESAERMAVAVTAGMDSAELSVWSTKPGEARPILAPGKTKGVKALALDRAGERLLAAFADGAEIRAVAGGDRLATLALDGAKPAALAATRDLERIVVGDAAGALHLFEGNAAPRVLPLAKGLVLEVELSPAGHLVAAVAADHVLRVHRWSDGAELLHAELKGFVRIAFSPDGRHLAVGDLKALRLYTVADTADAAVTPGAVHDTETQAIASVAFAPGSQELVAARQLNGPDALWRVDLASGQRTSIELKYVPLEVSYAPDGARLLIADNEGGINVLALASGPPRRIVVGDNSLLGAHFISGGAEALALDSDPGAAIVPAGPVDRRELLQASGAASNLRVCRKSLDVVAVTGEVPEGVFAPEALCVRE